MPGPCLTPERLAAALRSRQPGGGDADLVKHLSECPACQAQLEALAGGSSWLEAKARTHAATTKAVSEPLRKAMRVLESHGAQSAPEAPSPPKLDFLQPSDQPGVLGRFGPYEVIAHVASGGMGLVLKARDPALDRIVALKILSPTLAANALARARFVREARAAAAVVHEHVVPIYAVDECRGLPYLVMQFVKGRTLAERIRATGPLRLEEILRIGAQTASGLAAAHAQGLIHRDVKPGNILLENSVERVKLTDFGLARAADDNGLTRTGELAGTPEYMAPEQAGSGTVDHRADLFSFGSVLYAMCTGGSPFESNSVFAVIRKVCDERPPSVHELNPAIPRWLSDLIAKLMAKAPAERFQSAQEVTKLLEGHLARVQYGEVGKLPDRWMRREPTHARRSLLYAVGAVALLAVVGSLLFALRNLPAPSSAFVVRNEAGKTLGSFTDLTDAVRAAPSNGVIELRWNGPREMSPTKLSDKQVTLRAAKDFRPRWVHTNSSRPALSAGAALTLEDIEFVLETGDEPARGNRPDRPAPGQRGGRVPARPPGVPNALPSGVGLISISNAPLRLSRCVVQLRPPARRFALETEAMDSLAAIVLENVADCEIKNSLLFALPGKAILWRQTAPSAGTVANSSGESSLSLSNCLVKAHQAFWLERPENPRAQLQLVRCTFDCPNLIRFPKNSAGRAITVVGQANLFATITIIWDDGGASRNALTSLLHWQGRENLFGHIAGIPAGPGYVVLASEPRGSWPTTLLEWKQWWPESEAGSREVTIRFPRDPNVPPPASGIDFARAAYKVDRLDFIDGPPLPPEQSSHFGADIANVGPATR